MVSQTKELPLIASLDISGFQPAYGNRLDGLLPGEAWDKVSGYLFEDDRRRALGSELLKRSVLAGLLEIPVAGLSFQTGSYGKPRLGSAAGLHFNLSHSGRWVLLAVDERPVGVDIERITDPPEVGEVVYSGRERDLLDALPEGDQPRRFFELWTFKESYIKALGLGFSAPLTSITILPGERGAPLIEADGLDTDWVIRHLEIAPGYSAALCTRTATEPSVRRFGWEELLERCA